MAIHTHMGFCIQWALVDIGMTYTIYIEHRTWNTVNAFFSDIRKTITSLLVASIVRAEALDIFNLFETELN